MKYSVHNLHVNVRGPWKNQVGVCWHDPAQGVRFHFWVDPETNKIEAAHGHPSHTCGTLYRNPISVSTPNETRKLDIKARVNREIVALVLAECKAAGLIEAALAAAAKQQIDEANALEREARLADSRAQWLADNAPLSVSGATLLDRTGSELCTLPDTVAAETLAHIVNQEAERIEKHRRLYVHR